MYVNCLFRLMVAMHRSRKGSVDWYDDLLCWQEAVVLCEYVYTLCDQAWIPLDDEFACRWYLASLNISWKIAYAYGPEDISWFLERLPAASKYAAETVFWSWVALQKWYITATQYNTCVAHVESIRSKISSICHYLERYWIEEQASWKLLFRSSAASFE